MTELRTTLGVVRGAASTREGCERVIRFLGIPYAEPPVGPRRFLPPAPRAGWTGVLDGTVPGDVAPQPPVPAPLDGIFQPRHPQGPDHLTLNIWTPDPTGEAAVLVWFHGGGFQIGAGTEDLYDGARFARDGVVCVTVGSRLGIEGFLDVGDVEGSGNFGTLDQIAALRWLQEHVHEFGGDPSRVTVAGESSGAMSVACLLAAPAATGLFRAAICQSGAGHNGLTRPATTHVAAAVSELLGISHGDVDALRRAPTELVLDVQAQVAGEAAASGDRERWGPLLDRPWTIPFQPLLGADVVPVAPIEAVRRGDAAAVALLVGYCAEEYRLHLGAVGDLFPLDDALVDGLFGDVFGAQGPAMRAAYVAEVGDDNRRLVAALQTDRQYRVPAVLLAEAQHDAGGRAWMYRLSHRSSAFDGRIGAGHATDLPYVFDLLDEPTARLLTGIDAPQALADDIHRAWVHFVTHCDPSNRHLPWPEVGSERLTMDLASPCQVLPDPDRAVVRRFDQLPEHRLGV